MSELIISKDDLVHNINVIKGLENDDYTIIAVVKGNGYGCGLLNYVNILKANGINYFAVATYEEAIEFRKYFSDRLLLLTPYNDKKILSDLVNLDVTLTIDNVKQAEFVNFLPRKSSAHIKINTGLNRYGFKFSDIPLIVNMIKSTANIEYEGIYSHFANSLAKDSKFTILQYSRFVYTLNKLKDNKIDFKLKHICNSSGYFKYPTMHLNAARIGSAFIGIGTGTETELKKIGTYHTNIMKILEVDKGEYIGYGISYKVPKKMNIAILPIGYYDGIGKCLIDQRFSFKSKLKRALVNIKKLFRKDMYMLDDLNIVGQIGMHDTVVDITSKDYQVGDDIYFYIRPIFIDTSVKRVYK